MPSGSLKSWTACSSSNHSLFGKNMTFFVSVIRYCLHTSFLSWLQFEGSSIDSIERTLYRALPQLDLFSTGARAMPLSPYFWACARKGIKTVRSQLSVCGVDSYDHVPGEGLEPTRWSVFTGKGKQREKQAQRKNGVAPGISHVDYRSREESRTANTALFFGLGPLLYHFDLPNYCGGQLDSTALT